MAPARGPEHRAVLGVALVLGLAGCGDPVSSPVGERAAPALSGGETTVFDASSGAFEQPAANLSGADLDRHVRGDAAFEATFVAAPAALHGGLGPVFNHSSCIACHLHDGRGTPAFANEPPFVGSLLVRVSVPGTDDLVPGAPRPVPGFGGQIADRAIFQVAPEARPRLVYGEVFGTYDDGETWNLRQPRCELRDPYIPLPGGTLMSVRMALPVFGRGLLEAIPEAAILALADPTDADADGVSGRPNWVWDDAAAAPRLGRFGWKAGQPTLRQQSARAYQQDMGITSPYFPDESSEGQSQCDALADDPEIAQDELENVTFYVATLGVPARRNWNDPAVVRGESLFVAARCKACHVPTLQTGVHPIAALARQTIHPYTDMLLHDLGAALADGRPEFEADGREWRTPPLWGLGLTRTVSGVPAYLHDGRARTLAEAIVFHGGEAERSREAFTGMSRRDREALLAFLNSL